jgi:hypothetical protein
MNRKRFNLLIGLLWLALPLTALRYWLVWDQLPARIVTHFQANGQPNGWMTREVSLIFALGLTVFILAVFTVVLYLVQRSQTMGAFSWAFLGFCYLIVGFIYYANTSVLAYNLSGEPISMAPFLIVVPAAVVLLVAVYLGSSRGTPLPTQTWIAEEVHGSRLWALFFLLPLVIELGAIAAVPMAGVRVGLGLLAMLFLVIAIHAWTGFQYRFGTSGLEICTLGFRLRSIPSEQIREYAVQRWNPLGGYGIRGVGDSRAYVWGNKGVRIKTSKGEVFLGHSEPERIVRDLDAMKQYAHS